MNTNNFIKNLLIFSLILTPLISINAATNFLNSPDLKQGDTNEYVKKLQSVLNLNGFPVSKVSGQVGSKGFETTLFGSLTQKALSAFQSAYDIYPSTGYFGNKTKTTLQSLLNSNIFKESNNVALTSGKVIAANEAGCSPGYAKSIEHYGITWYFKDCEKYGQFATGDFWVLGPVVINNITPTSVNSPRAMHGSMLNPMSGVSVQQGFDDDNEVVYNSALNVGQPGGNTISAGNPLRITSGSLLSSESIITGGLRPQLQEIAILTIVTSAPPSGSFRPPYSGSDKTPHWNKSQLDYSALRSLTPVASTPDLNTLASRFEKPWIEINTQYMGRDIHPKNNQPDYGRDMGYLISDALLSMHLNYSNAQKEILLTRIVQYGIDIYGAAKNGAIWESGGGHNQGRKAPMIFAGRLLNDTNILQFGNTSVKNIFQDDLQMFYVSQSDVNLARYTADGRYRDPYTGAMIGMPEWGEQHNRNPSRDGSNWDVLYRTIANSANVGGVLAIKMMGLESVWNNPVVFEYMKDYYVPEETPKAANSLNSFQLFHSNMWKAYSGTISQPTAPTISIHPQTKTVTPGTSATLTVLTSGASPLTYQWYKNNTAISGATSASYTTPILQIGGDATYYVRVSNSLGTVNSNTASVTVINDGKVWTTIAQEDQSFTVPTNTIVRYGVGSTWVTKTVSGTATCSNTFFGSDPLVGADKFCQKDDSTVVTSYNLTTTTDGTGTGTIIGNTSPYTNGTVVTLTAVPANNSTLTKWTGCSIESGASCVLTMDSSKTVTATFTLIPVVSNYTLTTTATNGTITRSPNQTSYTSGTAVTLTATPNTGYIFSGWTGDCSGTGSCMVTMNANKSVTATFTLIPVVSNYTLTTTATNGTITRSPNQTSYTSGTAVTLTATPNTGYTFSGWTGDCSGTGSCMVTMNANKTVTATFTLIPVVSNYTLTTTATNGTITRSPNQTSYTSGTAVTLTATPNTGYIFSGWSGSCLGTNPVCSITMNTNATVTANFTVTNQTLNPLINTISSVVAEKNLTVGQTYTATVNYETKTASYISFNLKSKSASSRFYYSSNEMPVPQGKGTKTFTFTVPAKDETGTTNITSEQLVYYTVLSSNGTWAGRTDDDIVYSVYAKASVAVTSTYTLTTNAVNGTITSSPNQTSYTSGTPVTLTATPNPGYKFSSWSGCTATTNMCTVTMTGTITTINIAANFVPITYTLTVTKSGTGAGDISGNTSPYNSGSSATLTATPQTGSVFEGWSGACTGTNTTCTVSNITGNQNVGAVFNLIPAVTVNTISSVVAEKNLEVGKTYTVTVNYEAKTASYIQFNLKSRSNSQRYYYSSDEMPVPQGKGSKTFTFTVPAKDETGTTNITSEQLIYYTVLSSNGTWAGRTDDDIVYSVYAKGISGSTPIAYTVTSNTFTKDLKLGMTDSSVASLQRFLNNNGYTVSTSGVGSSGNESNYFGPATKSALIRFQTDNNIIPASGYFGKITRTLINGR